MTLPDYAACLKKSQKFLDWRPKMIDSNPTDGNHFAFAKPVQKHFSSKEPAQRPSLAARL